VQSVVKNRIASNFSKHPDTFHPTSNTHHQAHIQPLTKKNKKFAKSFGRSKKTVLYLQPLSEQESHVPRKKVKNKFGLNSKGFVSLPSVQKRKGD